MTAFALIAVALAALLERSIAVEEVEGLRGRMRKLVGPFRRKPFGPTPISVCYAFLDRRLGTDHEHGREQYPPTGTPKLASDAPGATAMARPFGIW